MATMTFNTGAGDGLVSNNATAQTWANYRADTTADKADYTSATVSDKIGVEFFGGNYYGGRLFLPFDTSALPDDATITGATLSIWTNQVSVQPTAVVVQTSQASTSSLVTTDFDNLTLGTAGSAQTNIANGDGETQFTLNATGLTWISKTGFSNLGVVAYEDSVNSAPASNMTWSCRMSEYSATDSNKIPKLVVTYTVPDSGGFYYMSV